jgi:hypothetical protein
VKVLAWHVHGSWMTAFVHGVHDYLVPVLPDRGPDGGGRATTYPWPDAAREVTPEALADERPDVVVLQRPHELDLVERWTGRRVGTGPGELPGVYVEHNTPRGDVTGWRHPLADRRDVPVVHVTHFNAAMWDTGDAPVRVVEHGVPDPGARYTGEEPSLAVACNEPVRRERVAGLDLAARVAQRVPVAVFGIGTDGPDGAARVVRQGLAGTGDLPQADLHAAMARHRAYLHPYRWTSLGLSLVEAMHLAMPVLVLATTAAPESVPEAAGLVTTDVDALAAAAEKLVADPELARAQGLAARRHALARFGLQRFLDDWDVVLAEAAR